MQRRGGTDQQQDESEEDRETTEGPSEEKPRAASQVNKAWSSKVEAEGGFFTLLLTPATPMFNIILKNEKLEDFPLNLRQGRRILSLFFSISLEILEIQ